MKKRSVILFVALLLLCSHPACGRKGPDAPPDTTSPTVSSVNPASGEVDVPVNRSILANFSEAMNPSTINGSTFAVVAVPPDAPGANVTGAISCTGTTAVFTPSSALQYSTTYTVTISADVRDLSGNALAAPYVSVFTTGAAPDTTPPEVVSVIPDRGASNVAVTTFVSVSFSEAMIPANLEAAFTLKKKADGTIVNCLFYYNNTTAVFAPNGLAAKTTYVATITTGATDLAGNGLMGPYTWEFTTH
jgi:predicted small lipoprotein YifL